MKSIYSRSQIFTALAAVVLVSFATAPLTHAQGRKKNPTSKLFVADITGTAQIDTGETIDVLTQKSVYSAQGTVIQTQEKSTDAMVFSNGTGIYLDPNTRLEVRKFVQEPFKPNRDDMNVEPSISNTQAFLARGTVGLCTSKMVAGSTMNYGTPQGTVRIKGRKVVIDVDEKGTTVSSIEGEMTIHAGNLDAGGTVIKAGQQAFIPAGGGGNADIQVQDITPTQMQALDDKVSSACTARKAVYFESHQLSNNGGASRNDVTAFNQEGADDEITAIPTTPATTPVQTTVSVANLPKS